ncbi:MAG: hypothetical protein ACI9G1_002879 [Pirellulaceae bacterium]|jgi:hypothetical protein
MQTPSSQTADDPFPLSRKPLMLIATGGENGFVAVVIPL